MGIQEADYDGAVPVDGYGPGFFRVGGKKLIGPTIVTPKGPSPWGGLDDADALTALAGQVDVLFIGMGPDMARLPSELAEKLEAAGLMVEPMATPTAARSYNLTLSEGRRVACALIPV